MIAHYRMDEWGRYGNQTGKGTREHMTEPEVRPCNGGAEIAWIDRWGRGHFMSIDPQTLAELARLAPDKE